VNLAVFADDPPIRIDQYRGIEMMSVGRELGVAERNPDAVPGCSLE